MQTAYLLGTLLDRQTQRQADMDAPKMRSLFMLEHEEHVTVLSTKSF